MAHRARARAVGARSARRASCSRPTIRTPACAKGTLAPKALHIALLDDAIERADSVGPYNKSLLYLVSRAFEPLKRMPLLGLADAWTGERSKIDAHIAFDVVMPLPGSPPFRLRGVVIHSGDFEGGHYTAAVRGREDVWYYCDDGAEPRVVPMEFVLARQAYILIDER